MDLFTTRELTADGIPQFQDDAPLAVRMRPRSLEELVGQEELLAPGSPLRRLIGGQEAGTASSIVLWGGPGTGKTTLAYLIARSKAHNFVELSAVSNGVKELRATIERAREDRRDTAKPTVLFVDEVHRFSKSQQDALLPAVENRWVILVAATTENPAFSVIGPLLSRSLLLTLKPLDPTRVGELVHRALEDERGLRGEYTLTPEAQSALTRLSGPDARKALTLLESAAAAARGQGTTRIDIEHVQLGAPSAVGKYDEDEHYDVTSAFIKSMRGSDPDATIYYLARMIAAGEDPRYIARRIMICASEDVGLAAPEVLSQAVAAAQAVALIGMPEGRIILSQAALAVALAPKSNRAYLAIDRALADIKHEASHAAVPAHLRDAHYARAGELGVGGYKYAHDYPHHVVAQQYLPAALAGKRYYKPTEIGYEGTLRRRLEVLRELLTPDPSGED